MKFESSPQQNSASREQESVQSRRMSKISRWVRRAVLFTAMVGSTLGAQGKTTEKSSIKADGTEQPATIEHVTDQIRTDWNDYLVWLDGKGLKGNPKLDHDDLGKKMFAEYCKSHPGTSLSPDVVKSIQDEFKDYRASVLKRWKDPNDHVVIGDVKYDKNKPDEMAQIEKHFMEGLSDPDGYPGSETTSHAFMRDIQETRLTKTIALPGGLGSIQAEKTYGDIDKKVEMLGFSKIQHPPENK